jgi:hypothetical protein
MRSWRSQKAISRTLPISRNLQNTRRQRVAAAAIGVLLQPIVGTAQIADRDGGMEVAARRFEP